MKKIFLFISVIANTLLSSCQNVSQEFIQSFPARNSSELIKTGCSVECAIKMNKEEALKYIYNNDTSKLYCTSIEYSNWDESYVGESYVEELLPSKCLRIDHQLYTMVGYTRFECDPNGVYHNTLMYIDLYDKCYHKKDSLLVYKANELDFDVDACINPLTKKIYSYNNTTTVPVSTLYHINENTVEFEILRVNKGVLTGPIEKHIEKLQWDNLFYSDECE